MADYAIGDIQGCYKPLMKLLDKINYNEHTDRLWFVGDLVNRGPDSLKTIQFIRALPDDTKITLGNHDLHLMSRIFLNSPKKNKDDTLDDIESLKNAKEIGHWLRTRSILVYDKELNIAMTHAGISPLWDFAQAIQHAKELETALRGDTFLLFLQSMYGNEPSRWSEDLCGTERLRYICNSFTRMRFCDGEGAFNLSYKGTIASAPLGFSPWFDVSCRKALSVDVVFGHWAALLRPTPRPNLYALDSGCYWGGELTALRIQDKTRFSVEGLAVRA